MKPSPGNLLMIIAVAGMFASCCPNEKKNRSEGSLTDSEPVGKLIADTITYDVIIRNPNSEDKWTDECLKNLNQETLIDDIFTMVYSKERVAYDFFTAEPLDIGAVRGIENEAGYSREQIGKIQFTEKWTVLEANHQIKKEIISIVLGYELYDEEGSMRGYRPIFKLYLN